jgi:K+-transporting ATPase ATPase A chain
MDLVKCSMNLPHQVPTMAVVLKVLGDNTPFWNIACGLVMLLGRYIPIIGPVAIAGILASKKYIPESNGTLKTDTSTFGLMVFAVIAIVAALAFFPALTLGPIAEYFSMIK